MKRSVKVFLTVITTVGALVVLGLILFFTVISKPVDLSFAQTVTLNHHYGEVNIEQEITGEDFEALVTICRGRAFNDYPSCGFGSPELLFEGDGKTLALYPACDDCATMKMGEDNVYFYSIGTENRKKLVDILEKYGVIFPCV